MDLCGYHLRCLNYGDSCSNCGHQQKDKNEYYLHDVLNVWPKGKEAARAAGEPATDQVPRLSC